MRVEIIDQQLQGKIEQINRLGMQQAAQMLTRLLRQLVVVELPPATLTDEQLQTELQQSEQGLGVSIGITGDLNGGMLLFLPERSAAWLSCQLLGQQQVTDLLAEPVSSTLKEVGNIIASAFLDSLANRLQVRALPSPPQLCFAPRAELLKQLQDAQASSGPIVCNWLRGDGDNADRLRGVIYLCAERAALQRLLVENP